MAGEKTEPSEKTKRLLFGSASRCAERECLEPLVLRYGNLMSINVEVAHIRSDKQRGPGYIPGYGPVHEFENLLLLCLKHHKLVDDNPETFSIELLEGWKEIQIGEAGTALADDLISALRQQVSTLAETVTALSNSRSPRAATVRLLAGRGSRGEAVMMPLDVYRRTTVERGDSIVYLGIEVNDRGRLQVQRTGLEFAFGEGAPAVYLPPEIRHRGTGREMRLIDQRSLRASMIELGRATHRLPLRFRGFVQLDDGHQVSSPWTSMLELPIWRDDVTEEDLLRLMR